MALVINRNLAKDDINDGSYIFAPITIFNYAAILSYFRKNLLRNSFKSFKQFAAELQEFMDRFSVLYVKRDSRRSTNTAIRYDLLVYRCVHQPRPASTKQVKRA